MACSTTPAPVTTRTPVSAPAADAAPTPPPSATPLNAASPPPPITTPYTAVATPAARVVAAARKARAAHDYNGDGHADLAVAVPQPGADGKATKARVEVLYGSAAGLTGTKRKIVSIGAMAAWDEDSSLSLASGDFDRDGYADLAISAPEPSDRARPPAHQLAVVFGSAAGLTGAPVTLAPPPAAGTLVPQSAAGDFNKDGYQDLVVTDDSAAWVAYGGRGTRTGRASWRTVLSGTVEVRSLAPPVT
ncbi:FG-GAP repeat domain-containing protein [Sphaerisporangium fuscum]|uniref:FG-GAP repeat domain-containing protein n=1 Tax=Sphaerisporangium fuscum TaxID=2835868 RepID=UPI001BDD1D42|nr:VCBS repeat-containing protein [Sphaerisporangium fuscum]